MQLSPVERRLAWSGFRKIGAGNGLKAGAKRAVVGSFVLVMLSAGDAGLPLASGANPAPGGVPVTRTVPKVEPPKSALEFSASPTPQEIFRARVFEEPLVPVGTEPDAAENAALADALLTYSKRGSPDDFAGLTRFLEQHPQSPWRAALLTDLGLEYYNTAYYSRALAAWSEAWSLAKNVREAKGKAIADRALGELVAMHARVGHMSELEALLKSVEGRPLSGPATERVANARGGLADMKERPEISFRCGPLALLRIVLASEPEKASKATSIVHASASTQRGFSLRQVAELSRELGLNYQMARRQQGATFIVPSVVHWKVGHYAALIRQDGDRYLLQDPTFRNDVWATQTALEEETSGYFVVPAGKLPGSWSAVESAEGDTVWGKGNVGGPDPGAGGNTPEPPCQGMAVSTVDPLFISLTLLDNPVGYSPPVGPEARVLAHYNQRDPAQPAIFAYSNFGPKWSINWIAYITDNPMNTNADVQYYRMGGFVRYFTGFNPNTQVFSIQVYDRNLLRRTSPTSYEMLMGDGTKLLFGQPDGSAGTSRRVFLTQIVDPFGNTLTLTYDVLLRLVAVTDAIGQVTTIFYANPADNYKITKVIDPFGRFATFDYDAFGHLIKITDVIGLTSQFIYDPGSDFLNALITPYGTTSFAKGENGTTRSLETTYPDGTKDRFEFNQSTTLGIPAAVPANTVPGGMGTANEYISFRNTYYWSRNAYAKTYPDYTKARIYHWLHTPNLASASGILENTKEPLENRVWYDYAGQTDPIVAGANSRPAHIGRVLDDGTTQLHTYAYDGFGHLTNSIDPLGRTLSYIYDTNNIDLLEVLQTRAGAHEVLFKATYNSQHLLQTSAGASGQTTAFNYNAYGQLLTETDPKNGTFTCTYDTNGYLLVVDSPLPGTNDVVTSTYDAYGRLRTKTDVNGYTQIFDYDNLDRLTRITYPDSTSMQFTYDRLDVVTLRDRAGRQTSFEYDNMRQLTKKTDPLGRVTLSEWCRCGDIKSLTDPMGRTTLWLTDEQGRRNAKQYGDGSQVKYLYENTTSRLREVIDEKQQATLYAYNLDNSLKSVAYANATVPTPGVSFTYGTNYEQVTSMTDGTGTTTYSYVPVTIPPVLGAGNLASVDGPLPNDTITYSYDELGRRAQTSINGVPSTRTFDAVGRIIGESNVLGSFTYAYDGGSTRVVSQSFPNGQTANMSYGSNLQDFSLQQITYAFGATPISQFVYGRDIPRAQITTWSQQTGSQSPSIFSFGYDAANELLAVAVTNTGTLVSTFAYGYDPAGNTLTQQIGGSNYTSTYNALNQVNTSTAPGASRTNEWDAAHRLTAVNAGNLRTEFAYDGRSRMKGIRQLLNGVEVSHRLFVWKNNEICEERDATGALVTKRYFRQGMKVETGPTAGAYYYTRDHLDSIRELTDGSGNVRARYAYDPFGLRTKVSGDVEADFGFTGMFWASEAALEFTHFRTYDPGLGRWLSRDPLQGAELKQGPNLYAYVGNEPVNNTDPEGLMSTVELCVREEGLCEAIGVAAENEGAKGLDAAGKLLQSGLPEVVSKAAQTAQSCTSSLQPQLYQAGVNVVQTAFQSTVPPELGDTVMSAQTFAANQNWQWAYNWFLYATDIDRAARQLLPWAEEKEAFQALLARMQEILQILNSEL